MNKNNYKNVNQPGRQKAYKCYATNNISFKQLSNG